MKVVYKNTEKVLAIREGMIFSFDLKDYQNGNERIGIYINKENQTIPILRTDKYGLLFKNTIDERIALCLKN